MTLISHSISRALWITALVSAGWLSGSPPVSAQDDPLFRRTRDPKVITQQIKAALPTFERGLALLISSTDPEPTGAALVLLNDTYRYLRAAQESSEVLQSISKFPDPLIALRDQQIDAIRERLIRCRATRTYLSEPGARTACIEGLEGGIRKLRVMVATLP